MTEVRGLGFADGRAVAVWVAALCGALTFACGSKVEESPAPQPQSSAGSTSSSAGAASTSGGGSSGSGSGGGGSSGSGGVASANGAQAGASSTDPLAGSLIGDFEELDFEAYDGGFNIFPCANDQVSLKGFRYQLGRSPAELAWSRCDPSKDYQPVKTSQPLTEAELASIIQALAKVRLSSLTPGGGCPQDYLSFTLDVRNGSSFESYVDEMAGVCEMDKFTGRTLVTSLSELAQILREIVR